MIKVDCDRTKEIPKMHFVNLGNGRYIMKRLVGAKGYPACDLCKKNCVKS